MMEALNQVAALAVGLMLGFFFERRALKGLREQNTTLREELTALRHSVYSMGGTARPSGESNPPKRGELTVDVIEFVRAAQDPEGRVRRSSVLERFSSLGYPRREVEQALISAESQQKLRLVDKWVVIK